MITFSRDGTKVKVAIDPKMFDGNHTWLYWECNNDWYADLLMQRMQKEFQETVQAIREEEYNRGWSDKASKKKEKATWFTTVFRRVHSS